MLRFLFINSNYKQAHGNIKLKLLNVRKQGLVAAGKRGFRVRDSRSLSSKSYVERSSVTSVTCKRRLGVEQPVNTQSLCRNKKEFCFNIHVCIAQGISGTGCY